MWGSIVESTAQIVGYARPNVVEVGGSLGDEGLSNRTPNLGAGRVWARLLVIIDLVKGMRCEDSLTASKISLRSKSMGAMALRGIASDKTFFKAYVIGLHRALASGSSCYVQAGTVIRLRASPEDPLTPSATTPALQVLLWRSITSGLRSFRIAASNGLPDEESLASVADLMLA